MVRLRPPLHQSCNRSLHVDGLISTIALADLPTFYGSESGLIQPEFTTRNGLMSNCTFKAKSADDSAHGLAWPAPEAGWRLANLYPKARKVEEVQCSEWGRE